MVTLQDITGGGAMKIDALPTLSTGDVDRKISQAWARAIHATNRVQGILYQGAHDLGEAFVLWETAPALVVVEDSGVAQDFPIIQPGVWGRARRSVHQSVGLHLRKIPSTECEKCVERGLA
jgi:RES domain